MSDLPSIIARKEGRIGRLTLNRPKALNALDLDMIRLMTKALLDWRDDDAVVAIMVDAVGEKAFCAGGDILALTGARGGDLSGPANFYAEEYRLNTLIKEYPKPYVAMIDGIVMGGGVGISVHGTRRVAGDRTLFAMPETGIGFYPDVGGSYFLPRMEGKTGIWLALTGARLKAPDAYALGIATDYAPSDQHEQIKARLVEDAKRADDVAVIVDSLTGTPEDGQVPAQQAVIDHCFGADSVESIIENLREDDGDWARKQKKILKTKSPLALKITLRQMSEGQNLNFRAAMQMELGLSLKFLAGNDFYEGVRALLVDRDNTPVWQPADLSDISNDDVAAYFVPLAGPDALRFLSE